MAVTTGHYTYPDGFWAGLIARIRNREPEASAELYRHFEKGVRFFLCRHLGPQDLDDRVHDIFIIVDQAIQRGEVRQPDRLMGYVRTIVHRKLAAEIDKIVDARTHCRDLHQGLTVRDPRNNPEQSAIEGENRRIIIKILEGISLRDREVLVRFYLWGQSPDQICAEMELTDTQFRLLKSRAKTRFGIVGKRKMAKRNIPFRPEN